MTNHLMIAKPTPEQCNALDPVYEDANKIGYAIWYPQMGGYCGRAVALLDRQWIDHGHSRTGGCIDVYVWHNDDLPCHNGEDPRILHHCNPEQFVEFGKTLAKLNAKGRRTQ